MLEFGLCIHVGVHMIADREMAKGATDLQNLAFDDVFVQFGGSQWSIEMND